MTKVDRIARLGERLAQSKFASESDHILSVVRGAEPINVGIAVEVERAAEKRAPNGAAYHVRIKASTESIARDRGIIPMKAWQDGGLRSFTDNPIILAFHDHKQPIGRSVHTEITGDSMVQYWEFHLETEISRAMQKLYERGFMRAASVGFLIREVSFVDELSDKDLEKLVEKYGAAAIRDTYWVAEKAELLETSAVPVPSDANALTFDFAINSARAVGIDVSSLRAVAPTGETMTEDEKKAAREAAEKTAREAEDKRIREVVDAAVATATADLRSANEKLAGEVAALRALVEKKPETPAAETESRSESKDGLEIAIEKRDGESDEAAVSRYVEEYVAKQRGAPVASKK